MFISQGFITLMDQMHFCTLNARGKVFSKLMLTPLHQYSRVITWNGLICFAANRFCSCFWQAKAICYDKTSRSFSKNCPEQFYLFQFTHTLIVFKIGQVDVCDIIVIFMFNYNKLLKSFSYQYPFWGRKGARWMNYIFYLFITE